MFEDNFYFTKNSKAMLLYIFSKLSNKINTKFEDSMDALSIVKPYKGNLLFVLVFVENFFFTRNSETRILLSFLKVIQMKIHDRLYHFGDG